MMRLILFVVVSPPYEIYVGEDKHESRYRYWELTVLYLYTLFLGLHRLL